MADLLQHLKARHEYSHYHQMHGLKILSLSDGYAEVLMPASPDVLNPLGNVHGGAIYTLCDVAAGTAAASRGLAGVTLTSAMNYLRPGHAGEDLLAKTRELKHGRTTAVYEVDVYQGERLIASGQFTMFYTGERIEL